MKSIVFCILLAVFSISVAAFSSLPDWGKLILYFANGVSLIFDGMMIQRYIDFRETKKMTEFRKNMLLF